MLKRMLDTNPRKRITASQILKHPWIMKEATIDKTSKLDNTYSTTMNVLDKLKAHKQQDILKR